MTPASGAVRHAVASRHEHATSQRVRVLHVIKGLGRGGAEMLLVETLRAANRLRFEYGYAYFLPEKSALAGPLQEADCAVQCFPARNAASMLLRSRDLAQWIRTWGAHIVHCHLPLAGITGRLSGRLTGVPVVYTEHNKLERYHPVTRRMHLATWDLQDHVIAVSSAVEGSIRKYTRSSLPITVLANGVDTNRFDADGAEALEDVRTQLGISDGQPVIGTVAVFRKQKRLEDWVEAARIIHGRFPQAVFVLVGGGPLEEQVRDQVKRCGLDGAFRFAGVRQDVRPWMRIMDVFMMSSAFEGLPVALLEAMSMKRAVVATSVGGIPEVVTHGETGLLVEAGQPADLAKGAIELLAAPMLRARLGRAGREVIERQFGVQRMTAALEAIYLEVLEKAHRGPP